jgi:hypothetical protein
MDSFLTWQFLVSFAGCIVGTGVITQLFKQYIPMPTQLFSYIVALIIINVGALCLGVWIPAFFALSFINAGLVALASNGGFEAVGKLFSKP